MAEKKRRTIDPWKKKKWFSLIAPKSFDSKVLGESVAEKPNSLIGRKVLVSAGELSGKSRKHYITLEFQVKEVQGQKAITKITGHKIDAGYMKRVIKRRSRKIEQVEDVETSDKQKVRVKTIISCLKKIKREKGKDLRKIIKEEVNALAKKRKYSDFIQEIIFGSLSPNIFNKSKKVCRIKRVEIVKSKLLSKEKE